MKALILIFGLIGYPFSVLADVYNYECGPLNQPPQLELTIKQQLLPSPDSDELKLGWTAYSEVIGSFTETDCPALYPSADETDRCYASKPMSISGPDLADAEQVSSDFMLFGNRAPGLALVLYTRLLKSGESFFTMCFEERAAQKFREGKKD